MTNFTLAVRMAKVRRSSLLIDAQLERLSFVTLLARCRDLTAAADCVQFTVEVVAVEEHRSAQVYHARRITVTQHGHIRIDQGLLGLRV